MFNELLYPQDPSQSLYRLDVPGIRENTPLVQLGDVVKLRQVRSQPGFGPMGGGSFSGYQYDAYVYGMDKTVGYIVLRVDHLMMESGRFNVCFGVQERRWAGPVRAIEDLGAELRKSDAREKLGMTNGTNGANGINGNGINGAVGADIGDGGFVRRMLFPEKAYGVWQRSLGRGAFNRGWFDGELNYEQQVRLAFLAWLKYLSSICSCTIRRHFAIKKLYSIGFPGRRVSYVCFAASPSLFLLSGGDFVVKIDGRAKGVYRKRSTPYSNRIMGMFHISSLALQEPGKQKRS